MDKESFVILIVDDEEGILEGLGKILSIKGYSVMTASTGSEAVSLMKNKKVDLAFIDLHLEDIDGIEVVRTIQPSNVPIVIMTAYASVETAVSSMKIGVVDYIQKPFDNESIISIADRMYYGRMDSHDESGTVSVILPSGRESKIILKSEHSRNVFETVEKIKNFDIPVLLLGESGTGKEVIAKLIHQNSNRNERPFVGINCSAIPVDLLESELFGYEKGAFSGAVVNKPGKFEVAGKGTLYLDEIGDMDIRLQAKLLRVIEEKTFEHVGGVTPVSFEARIIASTNRDMRKLIEDGGFRSDLYYRLKGVELQLAPLRERKEDLEELIKYFVKYFADSYGKNVTISSEASKYLKEYGWPGNIRELKNVIESSILLSSDFSLLVPEHFRIDAVQAEHPAGLQMVEKAEQGYIMTTLEKNRFNRTLAAKELQISRKTLYNKIKKYSIT